MFGGSPRAIKSVTGTHIFARDFADGRQLLAYSMKLVTREPVAMILPLPVTPASSDDAVRFVDLSDYPGFFDELEVAFLPVERSPAGGLPAGSAPERSMLKVQEVGDFVASFVPTLGDFDRLDPQFRLDESVWAALPHYADYGFAVFQLADVTVRGLRAVLGRTRKRAFHPMVFEFPRRDPDSLYFPTTHVHDGTVPNRARFRHTLTAQAAPGRYVRASEWSANTRPLTACLSSAARRIVDFNAPAARRAISEVRENADVTVPVA